MNFSQFRLCTDQMRLKELECWSYVKIVLETHTKLDVKDGVAELGRSKMNYQIEFKMKELKPE